MLLISRGMVGVGIGGIAITDFKLIELGAPVAFSLFTEFLPLETRGKNLIMIEGLLNSCLFKR